MEAAILLKHSAGILIRVIYFKKVFGILLFCRLSAVFGGVYALSQSLEGLIMDCDNNFKSLICGGQRINAPYIVLSADKAPEELVKNINCKDSISRGIFITDRY